jgi:pyruvate,water dikinase
MMCEIPSNALLADQFLQYFDGFSIGSNDMTQLALGVDRDSGIVAGSFDERDPAVKALLHMADRRVSAKAGKYVGICGQGPSTIRSCTMAGGGGHRQPSRSIPIPVVETWLFLARGGRAVHA